MPGRLWRRRYPVVSSRCELSIIEEDLQSLQMPFLER